MHKLTSIICFLLSLVGCDSSNRSASQASSSAYKYFEIEGISLDLPSAPSGPQLLPIPPNLSSIIKRQAGYESVGENCSVLVFHVEQDVQYPTNLKFAIDGGLENMKRVPGTTDFTSQPVNNYPMPELNTSEVIAHLKHNGVPKQVYMFAIAKDNHLYQITIEGEDNAVKECASRVFPSIKIKPSGAAGNSKKTSTSPAPQRMTIAGLNLELSGHPQKAEFGMGEATPNTISQDSYVLQDGSTQFGITHTIHRTMDGGLEDNARGIVEGQKTYSIVDGIVDGLPAKRITLELDLGGSTQHLSMVMFAKGNSFWQVASIDPSMTLAHGKLDRLIPTIKVTE